MESNIAEQKRKRLKQDFWFLTAVIAINFLLYGLREITDDSTINIIIGYFWFPALFAIIGFYGIFRFFSFLIKKMNRVVSGIICFVLVALVLIIAMYLFFMIFQICGHGPLGFFYERHLRMLIVATVLLAIPYLIIIINIRKLRPSK